MLLSARHWLGVITLREWCLREMISRSWGPLVVLAVFVWGGCKPDRAQAADVAFPELEKLYREVVELRSQILDERGQIQLLELESTLLTESLSAGTPSTTQPAPRVLPIVREQWIRSADTRNGAIEEYLTAKSTTLTQARLEWERAQLSSLRFREHIRSMESQLGVDLDATRAFTWLSLLLWLTPSTVCLLFVSWMLRTHEQRIENRKALRSLSFIRSVSAVGLAAIVPVTLAGCTPSQALTPTTTWLLRQSEELNQLKQNLAAELLQVREQRTTLEREVGTKRLKIQRRLDQLFSDGSAAETSAVARSIVTREDESLKRLESALRVDALLVLYEQSTAAIAGDLDQRRTDLQAFVVRHQARTVWISTVALSTTGIALVVCSLPFVRARRRSAQRWRNNRRVCPRCLAEDSLKRLKSMVECSACKGRFPASLLNFDRLCFPTVGVRGSGKTHWIIEFFDEVRNNDVNADASIKWVESGNEVESKFDSMLEALQRGENPEGTLHEKDRIPEPVLFSVRDCDWMRPRNDLSLLIFDLSGEVMTKDLDLDKLKERAMLMDGFLLFLDPRQVRPEPRLVNGKPVWLNKEDQLKGVHKQRRDMKAARELGDNDVLDVPVAVCIPKLDLIPTHNPLGGAAHALLDELRLTEHEPITYDLIQKRSDLIAQYLKEMFLGWNIERDLKDNFGSRYMFFPLTPVNINADEIGVEDLAQRSRNPFGIQEPILWLLHISGYSVLK